MGKDKKMSTPKTSKSKRLLVAWLTLVAIALLSAVIWRAEVEYHGWEGLTWIGYFHWAIPAGAVLFIGWVVAVNRQMSRFRRVGLAVVLAVGFVLCCQIAEWSLNYLENWRVRVQNYEEGWMFIKLSLASVLLILFPHAAAGIAEAFGLRVTWHRFAISQLFYLASAPVAMLALLMTHHRTEVDFIHTIKSGFIIPFLVVALGILFLPRRDTQV